MRLWGFFNIPKTLNSLFNLVFKFENGFYLPALETLTTS